jgi:hypothetical protein
LRYDRGINTEKRTVNFFSEGARLEGDLFLPSNLKLGEQRAGIVLCHGFTGVRSLILESIWRLLDGTLTGQFHNAGRSEP